MSAPTDREAAKWAWLPKVEARDLEKERDDLTRHVAIGQTKVRDYGERFPTMRGRAWSDRHGLSVEASAHGELLFAVVKRRPGLGPLFVETWNRALREAARWTSVRSAVEHGDRSARIPAQAKMPEKYEFRGVDEKDQWNEVVELTEPAILGDPGARAALEVVFAQPTIGHLFGPGNTEDDCRVRAVPGFAAQVRFPNDGNFGVELGWQMHVLSRRAIAAIRDDYATNYEDESRKSAEESRKAEKGPGGASLYAALAEVRRFSPVPKVEDHEAEDQIDEDDRADFLRTVKSKAE